MSQISLVIGLCGKYSVEKHLFEPREQLFSSVTRDMPTYFLNEFRSTVKNNSPLYFTYSFTYYTSHNRNYGTTSESTNSLNFCAFRYLQYNNVETLLIKLSVLTLIVQQVYYGSIAYIASFKCYGTVLL